MLGSCYPEPIRILSDLHLGNAACALADVGQIRPLLDGARTVIFNGDTAEVRARSFKQRAAEEQAKLTAMLSELGVEHTIYITGNHDPRLSDQHVVTLMNGKVIVTHGDFLFRYVSPWSKKLRHCRPRIDAILANADSARMENDFDYRLEVTRECCDSMAILEVPKPRNVIDRVKYLAKECWPPTRVPIILRIWLTAPRQIIRALEQYHPDAHTMVFGHIHCPGIWHRRGRTAINTGGFLTAVRASVLEIENDVMSYYPVLQRDKLCVLGKPRSVREDHP